MSKHCSKSGPDYGFRTDVSDRRIRRPAGSGSPTRAPTRPPWSPAHVYAHRSTHFGAHGTCRGSPVYNTGGCTIDPSSSVDLKHVPACKDQPTWFLRGQTGGFKGTHEHLYRRQELQFEKRSGPHKRRVCDANCAKAVGSGYNSNATATPVSPCFPSYTSTTASGELTNSLTCICRHNVGGLDQDQRFAHDIEHKVIDWMQFSRMLQSSDRLGK